MIRSASEEAMLGIRRREFITLLSVAAAAWPLAAHAQQGERVRRIGVLVPGDESDPVWKPRLSAFTQSLAGLGWTDGRNVRIDLRFAGGDPNRMRALAQELVGLQPDHPDARREAGRSAGAVSGQIRDGPEPQDRQGARSCRAALDPAARRRADRIICRLCRFMALSRRNLP